MYSKIYKKINKRNILLFGIFFVMFIFITVGYSEVKDSFYLNGTSTVNKTVWSIYFDNINVNSGSVETSESPVINNMTNISYYAKLNKPGDFYSFDFDIVNDGTIDSEISVIDLNPKISDDMKKYLNYSITYDNGVPLKVGDIIVAGDKKTANILFEYKEGEKLQGSLVYDFELKMSFVQAQNNDDR